MRTTDLLIALTCFCLWLPAQTQAQSNWVDLFEGRSFENWDRLNQKQGNDAIPKNWRFTEGGWLHLYNPGGGGSSLLLKNEVNDFELSFFWKIKKNANNGIKVRVKKYGNKTLGIEYQLLDDEVKNGKTIPKHRTASIYDLKAPVESKPLNPPGQLNHSRIVVRQQSLEHWLNGVKVASTKIGSDEWNAMVQKSKFAPNEGFGENESGKIMITDHGGEIWFRHVMLRKLD